MDNSLLIQNDPSKKGLFKVASINESALRYVGMDLLILGPGDAQTVVYDSCESGIIINSGEVVISFCDKSYNLKCRKDMFSGFPHAVYVPPGISVNLKSSSRLEAAIYYTPSEKKEKEAIIITRCFCHPLLLF